MTPSRIYRAVARRLSVTIFRLLGRDNITGTRIHKRGDLEKIGNRYGGWVVPVRLFDQDAVCYCGGCGEDISFDLGLIERFGCEVYGFDPTPRAISYVKEHAGQNRHYHFYEYGLWDKEDTLQFFTPKDPNHVSHSLLNIQKTEDHITIPVKRLSAIMKELGHKKLALLKIDIEGAEYKVIESIIEDKLDIAVICVEFDEFYNPLDAQYKARIKASVDSLLACGYELVHSAGDANYTFVKQ